MDQISGNQVVDSSLVLSSGIVSADHLTADGMLIYLQTRLTGIDDQINAAFEKQQQIEQIRKTLMKLQNATSNLSSDDSAALNEQQRAAFEAAMSELEAIDPLLHQSLVDDLANAKLVDTHDDGTFKAIYVNFDGHETQSLNQILGSRLKQLESSAQLEMIQLQSLMSARQTAIQLATNLVSAIGKGTETIVSNIGR